MSKELDLAAEYRHHANNLLAAAQFDDVEKTRIALVRIANDFERMANDLEAVDKANRLLRKYDGTNALA
jgi:purine nucleoside permease